MKMPSCSPVVTTLGQFLRVKPLDLVIVELWHAPVRDHGLATLGSLEVEPNWQACPMILTTARGTGRTPDVSTCPVHPAMLMCLVRCQATVRGKNS